MPEVQEVCEDVIASSEGSLACAVVDLTTGATVAAAYGPDTELNANRIGLVSVAVTDMFRGRLIRQFHRAWSSGNSVPEHFVREVQMATANSYQFISVVPARMDTLFRTDHGPDRQPRPGMDVRASGTRSARETSAGACGTPGPGAARYDFHTGEAARRRGTDAAPAPAGRSRYPSCRRESRTQATPREPRHPPSSVAGFPSHVPPHPRPWSRRHPRSRRRPSRSRQQKLGRRRIRSERTAVSRSARHRHRRGVRRDDVPKGPRGRMFAARRGPDRPKK